MSLKQWLVQFFTLPTAAAAFVAGGGFFETFATNSSGNRYPLRYPKEKPEAMRSGSFVLGI
jgi:hypothetical protein